MLAPLLSLALLASPPDLVSYPSGSETVQGFLALPSDPGPHPALILVHEWWGLNDFAKQKAKRFASQGYVTLAVDLYRGPPATDPDTAHQLARGLPEDRAKRDLAAAFTYLASRSDVDRAHIGSIGWCMGGGYALEETLQEPRLAASVIYYGRLPTDPAAIARIKAQLLGNYGAEDRGIPPSAVEAFVAQAKKAGVSADFKVYPDAGHGFASSADPAVFRTAAAKDADARTDAFLRRVLATAPSKK